MSSASDQLVSRMSTSSGRTDICGGVTDRDLAIITVAKVLLDISRDSLDVGGGVASWDVVDQLVPGKEQEKVVVFLKLVNGGKNVLEVNGIVRLGGFVSADGVFGGIDIQGEVDASIGQLFHAHIVVLAIIDCVDADGIDAQFLEPRCRDEPS